MASLTIIVNMLGVTSEHNLYKYSFIKWISKAQLNCFVLYNASHHSKCPIRIKEFKKYVPFSSCDQQIKKSYFPLICPYAHLLIYPHYASAYFATYL